MLSFDEAFNFKFKILGRCFSWTDWVITNNERLKLFSMRSFGYYRLEAILSVDFPTKIQSINPSQSF